MAAGAMRLSQGSIYPALIRLEQQGWIAAKWGLSETNRKVKFYSLTRAGRQAAARSRWRSGSRPPRWWPAMLGAKA